MASFKQSAANRANAQQSTGPRTPAGKARSRYNAMTHGLLAEAALLPDEDEATFRELERAFLDDLRPVGAQEQALAEEIVNLTWRLRRDSHVEAGIFTGEQAAESEEYWRLEARAMEQTWDDFYDLGSQQGLGGGLVFSNAVKSITNEERHAEANVHADEAAAVQRTPLVLLGGAFARDAAGTNALSKLGRYETQHRRARDRALQALLDLQARRQAAATPPKQRGSAETDPQNTQ